MKKVAEKLDQLCISHSNISFFFLSQQHYFNIQQHLRKTSMYVIQKLFHFLHCVQVLNVPEEQLSVIRWGLCSRSVLFWRKSRVYKFIIQSYTPLFYVNNQSNVGWISLQFFNYESSRLLKSRYLMTHLFLYTSDTQI